LWSKCLALYPFVGGAAGSHKYNLKDPRDLDAAYRLTFSGGLTHNANGITGNGSNGYANTNLNVNTVLSLNDCHISFYSRTDGALAYEEMSAGSTMGPYFQLAAKWTDGKTYCQINGGAQASFTNGSSAQGLFASCRTGASVQNAYRNATRVNSGVSASTSKPNANVFILSGNNSGVPSNYSGRNLAFASIGSGLSDADVASLYSVVQAFQTALGRQV
jgi:hypothetical protein